ncbi:hypothetical protein [Secundilactobacillus kimchicus]|uniref:hypothetical protein n=1 Tax=Secundilactobacillus kimchicus TaxID=528209 RepID=UPI0006D1E2DC|nr:hypothetical protein [Secundilactobacillus kimchicus]
MPENVANQLRVKAGDQVRLRVRNFDVQLQSDHSEVSLYQRIGFWWFVIPALLCSILFNVFYWIRDQNLIQLNGETSIGTDVIFSGTIVGTLLFTIFFYPWSAPTDQRFFLKISTGEIFQQLLPRLPSF